MNFNSILIGTDNAERLSAFYAKLLGEPIWKDESYSTWMIGSGAVSIGPHSEVSGSNSQPGRLIWNIETDDVKAEFERFKAAGATVIAEPYTFEQAPGSWIATFADPDGNYFQLMTPMGPPEA